MAGGRFHLFVLCDGEVMVGVEALTREQAERLAAREGLAADLSELVYTTALMTQGGESRVVFSADSETNGAGDLWMSARRHGPLAFGHQPHVEPGTYQTGRPLPSQFEYSSGGPWPEGGKALVVSNNAPPGVEDDSVAISKQGRAEALRERGV